MNIKNLFYTDSLIVRFLIWENWRYLFFLTGYYTYSTAQNKFHLIFSAYFRSFVSIYLTIVQIFKYKKCSSYKFFIELFSFKPLFFRRNCEGIPNNFSRFILLLYHYYNIQILLVYIPESL